MDNNGVQSNDYQDKLAKVLNDSVASEVGGDNLVYLSSGVVLEVVDVSPMLVLDVSNQFKMPPVPVIRDDEKDIDIPNPLDEDYLEECNRIKMQQGNAILDVLIAKGTRIYSTPDNVSLPTDDTWLEEAEYLLKTSIDRRSLSRYLAWVRYVAMSSNDDVTKLTVKVYSRLGVTEESLSEAFLPST